MPSIQKQTDLQSVRQQVAESLALKGWSQKDLSEKTGIAENTIGDFLRGKRKTLRGTIYILCDELGIKRG